MSRSLWIEPRGFDKERRLSPAVVFDDGGARVVR